MLYQCSPCGLSVLPPSWVFNFKLWATTFFIFSQLNVLPSSCNSRSCSMVITFTAIAGFTSGSLSLTSAEICFSQWSQAGYRNLVLCTISVIYLIWWHQDLLSSHLLDYMQLEHSTTVQHLSDQKRTESSLRQRSGTFYFNCLYNKVLPLIQSTNAFYWFQYPQSVS